MSKKMGFEVFLFLFLSFFFCFLFLKKNNKINFGGKQRD